MTNVMDQPLPPPSTSTPPPPPPPPAPVARRTPAGARVLWKVFAALLVIPGIAWGVYNVVVVLSHEERVETSSYPAATLTSIDVDNSAGSVRIVATDGDTVDVQAEISDGLRSTGERQVVVGGVLQLRSSCPNYGSDWCRVDYEISVPRSFAVVVDAADGSIDVTGVEGAVDVDTDDGSIEVSGLTGPLQMSNDNGRIEGLDLMSANVTANTDNGGVVLEFAAAPTTVVATSDNGSVEVVVPGDDEAYRLEISTDNGDRTEEIPVDSTSPRSITIRTDNGDVTARTATS